MANCTSSAWGAAGVLRPRPFLSGEGFVRKGSVPRGLPCLSLLLFLFLALPASPALGSGEPPLVVGAVAPHHNVAGALIDRLYERIREQIPHPARVILIGPDHFMRARQNIVFSAADWRTPSGLLRADAEGASSLKGAALRQDGVTRRDHGITEHIPRVRKFFGDVPVLPLVVKSCATDLQVLRVRRALEALLRERGGVVILSMDLSHYKPRAESDAEDERTLAALCAFRLDELNGLDVDCSRGARLLLTLLQGLGAVRSELLERSNSADFLPNASRTTGHATVLFTR